MLLPYYYHHLFIQSSWKDINGIRYGDKKTDAQIRDMEISMTYVSLYKVSLELR
jgi:hypothetical protein